MYTGRYVFMERRIQKIPFNKYTKKSNTEKVKTKVRYIIQNKP